MSDPGLQPAPPSKDSTHGDAQEQLADLASRVDILYRVGRHHLFLPFASLCLAGVLYRNIMPIWVAILPLILLIIATVATGRLVDAYQLRDPDGDPRVWARRFTWFSGIAGAAWGVGALVWFIPHDFTAEAFLTVAFLGMTAAEFIARCAYRPAYLAHAACSLTPLALRLFVEHNAYTMMSCVLVLFFGGVLYSYCEGIAEAIGESLKLRRVNAALVDRLSREKKSAETARDSAEASMRAKTAFVANISHELRTPLNALLGMAQLLERSDLDRAQTSHVKVLLEAGRGLKTLLDDVIQLSCSEQGDSASEEECDAAQAARTVGRLLQPRAWEKQLRVTVTAASELPRAAADPRRIRQVLLKIADNAVKFTERGGVEIRVDTVESNGRAMVRFAVADTGHGLPPEIVGRVFEPFSQADTSYARRHDGAGLGLAVAKRIVDVLGGEIGFESEAGTGATFWFTVPAAKGACYETLETAPTASEAPPPGGLTLLVAVGDETIRTHLGNLLEPFGNRLIFAASTSEAIALAARERFDAILASGTGCDTMAAAPGVKGPMLALVAPGMRVPSAAEGLLRWPASAGALYAGLRDLLGRAADATKLAAGQAPQGVAAINATAFAELEKSLGLPTLIEILQSYIQTAEALCENLTRASESESWDEAARIAQDIAGAAGGLGLAALTAAARGFTQKAREGDGAPALKAAAQAVMGEHERVRKALANLYPDAAA